MKARYIEYDYLKSFDRIDKILDESDNSFEELQSIPNSDKLSYTNGFYVNCSSIFVDIRKSSQLTGVHLRPKLAKLYRVFISEVVAVINGNCYCTEINIVGDCVSGIFDTPSKSAINVVFSTAAEIASLINVINCKFEKRDIEQIEVGIGISYGRALMVKAGYNGSGISDVIWMGDVVNEASKLSNEAENNQVIVSDNFYNNLNEHSQDLLNSSFLSTYHYGNIVNKDMNNWHKDNCKQKSSWLW